jgi:hypothetical protein
MALRPAAGPRQFAGSASQVAPMHSWGRTHRVAPTLRANFKCLIRISSQTAGPTYKNSGPTLCVSGACRPAFVDGVIIA